MFTLGEHGIRKNGKLENIQIDIKTDREIDKKTDKHTNIQTNRRKNGKLELFTAN